ncbi:hypothetical protein I302_100849 [Kwoniella bestiolae CBS 10118]|uniref:Uncharacterized protein n=1 Tax=Kwoniella bestiolae CBS 10118 TaxID=1296100 RepID=A0A1B9G682_9TREE|nr:hypothetical protein I302_04222 [Kwoniella bestiolae CBS 10118]OCF26536.1 hypothetical protein I302_04222 [Kwoniella bestiolae CBS 10118]
MDFQPSPMVCGGAEYRRKRDYSRTSSSFSSSTEDDLTPSVPNKRVRRRSEHLSTQENLLTVTADLEMAKDDLVKAQARTDMRIEEMRLARMEEERQEMKCEMLRERGNRMKVDLKNEELEGKVRGLESDLDGTMKEVGRLKETVIKIENDNLQLHAEVNMLKVNHQRSIDNFRSLQRQEIAQLKADHATAISEKDKQIDGLNSSIHECRENEVELKDRNARLKDWIQLVNSGSAEILK